MFFIKDKDLYWDGEKWVEDWHQAKPYGSAATAVNSAPNRECLATGFDDEQWNFYYNRTESEIRPGEDDTNLSRHRWWQSERD